ncbi:GMC oxidoreductase [Lactarius akahatsu]|uniref:GMC oxidoreductase n=1 Tax=Lactarius akahatsu TaxID=416441 RepID=A0AAD4LCM3_9AGAM|nr:GMC oxidoreductase [Lactarius akahatsu]
MGKRNIVSQSELLSSYDFVIVGGGTAGLVLASRLSEDANTTVLVLEAGDTGDAVAGSINIPGNAYYQSLWNSPYNWNFSTLGQPNAGNRVLPWPRGKVLGGSSAINGLYSVRPSQIELDAWPSLSAPGDDSAKSKWGWQAMLAAMKKSETFVPPSSDVQQAANIEYDSSSHGSSGPLYNSFPGYMVPLVGSWIPTLGALGVPETQDAYNGQTWGSFISTSTINPTNWTRSYARSAYIDSLPPRGNIQILPNSMVTRILFGNNTGSGSGVGSGDLTASAVEYASSPTSARYTVGVSKEVILAGGAIGSPTILMYSGIGPKNVLQTAGVQVELDLPGVGQHLQDHISTQLIYNTSAETASTIYSKTPDSSHVYSPTFLSFVNSATAYINLTTLLGESAPSFQSDVANSASNSPALLGAGQDTTVISGYEAIYNVSQQLLNSPLGHVEVLLSLTGGGPTVAIQVALQRPFSQGSLYITTNNPFDYPTIDPKYLSHTAGTLTTVIASGNITDRILLRAGAKFARRIAQAQPLAGALITELSPGTDVNTDDTWDNWVAQSVGTEFHPSSTCAMLPLAQGGVVDSDLHVYGLANVRVVDSSVFPMQFAAHEQAANLIRSHYNNPVLPSNSNNSNPTTSGAPQPQSSTSTSKSGASRLHFPALTSFMIAIGLVLFRVL